MSVNTLKIAVVYGCEIQKLLVMGKKTHPQMRKWVSIKHEILDFIIFRHVQRNHWKLHPQILLLISPTFVLISMSKWLFFQAISIEISRKPKITSRSTWVHRRVWPREPARLSRCSRSGDADPVIFRSFSTHLDGHLDVFRGDICQKTWWLESHSYTHELDFISPTAPLSGGAT